MRKTPIWKIFERNSKSKTSPLNLLKKVKNSNPVYKWIGEGIRYNTSTDFYLKIVWVNLFIIVEEKLEEKSKNKFEIISSLYKCRRVEKQIYFWNWKRLRDDCRNISQLILFIRLENEGLWFYYSTSRRNTSLSPSPLLMLAKLEKRNLFQFIFELPPIHTYNHVSNCVKASATIFWCEKYWCNLCQRW